MIEPLGRGWPALAALTATAWAWRGVRPPLAPGLSWYWVKPAGKPAGIFRLEGTAAVWAAGALVGVAGSAAQYIARAWMSSSLRPAAMGFMKALVRLLALNAFNWPSR